MFALTRMAAALCLLILSAIPSAEAMVMKRLGDSMVMTGKVVREDLERFKVMLAEGPLTRIILVDNLGGDLFAAYRIAGLIQSNKINTVVGGNCVSACAVIFMGGVERQMLEGKSLSWTRLGFHGPHKEGTGTMADEGVSENLGKWLKRASGGKFDDELLERAMKNSLAGNLVYFYYPTPEEKVSVFFCLEGVIYRKKCEPFEGHDAISSGILTTLEPLSLTTKTQ
jgi:hypothetical protein